MAASETAGGVPGTSRYDLLPKLVGYLDRHLIFPLLEFAADQAQDDEKVTRDITRAKFELLKKTNMTDYVASLWCELEGKSTPPDEFAVKKQQVLDRLAKFEEETSVITDLLQREDVVANLRSDKVANLEFLKKEHDVRGGVRSRSQPAARF